MVNGERNGETDEWRAVNVYLMILLSREVDLSSERDELNHDQSRGLIDVGLGGRVESNRFRDNLNKRPGLPSKDK